MKPDALIAAAARIEREWGYGYSIERVEHGPQWGSCTLHVCASDGSRFTVAADRYGNTIETESDRENAASMAELTARYGPTYHMGAF